MVAPTPGNRESVHQGSSESQSRDWPRWSVTTPGGFKSALPLSRSRDQTCHTRAISSCLGRSPAVTRGRDPWPAGRRYRHHAQRIADFQTDGEGSIPFGRSESSRRSATQSAIHVIDTRRSALWNCQGFARDLVSGKLAAGHQGSRRLGRLLADGADQCEYVSLVTVSVECPRRFETTAMSTTAASSSDEARWRRSCSRVGGSPARFTSRTKRLVDVVRVPRRAILASEDEVVRVGPRRAPRQPLGRRPEALWTTVAPW